MSHAYVVNIRDGDANLEGASPVRIDRANPVLGNPYRQARRGDIQERMRVLALHEAHLEADLRKAGPISKALDGLARKVAQGETIALQCWCFPLPCHGTALAKVINEQADRYRASAKG